MSIASGFGELSVLLFLCDVINSKTPKNASKIDKIIGYSLAPNDSLNPEAINPNAIKMNTMAVILLAFDM